ncbi:hypothetical protein M434DRAFT_314723 [Hypoxylon sp. CO27-5]|nr:hypothetical protein M434DRAFT_314723 [Hypoxylon sp. CO27-5]
MGGHYCILRFLLLLLFFFFAGGYRQGTNCVLVTQYSHSFCDSLHAVVFINGLVMSWSCQIVCVCCVPQ